MFLTGPSLLSVLAFLALSLTPVSAPPVPDEGMWPFDNLPLDTLEERYGFRPNQAWIDHVRRASVRVSTGGSGSFISERGLVMTNHHVALELVNALSSEEADFVTTGFHARTLDEELPCPGAELLVLEKIVDVTEEVVAAGEAADTPEAAQEARNKALAEIEAREAKDSGLRVEMVVLYGGGQFAAYHYEVFDDVRLVFAPEMRIAYYGGDFDNFTYPRYCLDMAFLRAWKDGAPADTSDRYFRWSKAGAKEEELTFVSGHPGRTSRLWPLSRMAVDRDVFGPAVLSLLDGRERALARYAARGDAARIEVLDELFSVRNSQKAYQGMQDGLRDVEIWERLTKADARFRADASGDAEAQKAFQTFQRTAELRTLAAPDLLLCRIDGEFGRLAFDVYDFGMALTQPEAERAPRLRGPGFERLRKDLLGPQEFDTVLARERLQGSLESALEGLGAEHPLVQAALMEGELPVQAAARIARTTKLTDAAYRKEILASGEAFEASNDPLLKIARIGRPLRTEAQAIWGQAGALENEASAALAKARFRLHGKSVSPDANFSLRLTFGVGRRYEVGTTTVPWLTTFGGLFQRHHALDGEEPFDLPERWQKGRKDVDPDVPMNFVSTHDIIGGNSGSPVFNRELEIVGLIFDGNIQSLPNNYLYLEKRCRAVSVHSQGMVHALERIYRAYELLAEIGIR